MVDDLPKAHFEYVVRLADDAFVLGHRLSEWSSRAPTMEEDIALSNIGLDLIGQARSLYAHAVALEGKGRKEDDLPFLRDAHEFRNVQLVERPNKDFAVTMARQLAYSVFAELQWAALKASSDAEIAGVAAKAEKECAYHVRHASEWVIRLGDGTQESHARAQAALDLFWPFTGEMFETDAAARSLVDARIAPDMAPIRAAWVRTVDGVLAEATLAKPASGWMQTGGFKGQHGEALGHLLATMQFLPRAYPGAKW